MVSSLLRCIITVVHLAAASHHHGLVQPCLHHGSSRPCPHHFFTAFAWPRPHLRFSASPRRCPLGCISASPRPHPQVCFSASPHPVLINAELHLLGLVLISVPLHLHGVVFCAASGNDSIAAPAPPQAVISFSSGRPFPLDVTVRGLGAPPASSAPDYTARGIRPLLAG